MFPKLLSIPYRTGVMMPDILRALSSPGKQLDDLLAEICRALQITRQQRERAERAYKNAGDWLHRPESSLAGLHPQVYPQGSLALGTTVRPRSQEEYDVDLVIEVDALSEDPDWLYERVHDELDAHGDFTRRLERKRRCLRLNYAGDFHLDVLPARSDPNRGGTCIEVPDRKLRSWKPSNPKGYRAWFEQRTEAQVVAAREAEPLPDEEPSDLKAVLKRVVQLTKRNRDVAFDDEDRAPRSVVLTTLAAEAARPTRGIFRTLKGTLAWMDQRIKAAGTDRVRVLNPTNPDEDFSEAWDRDDGESYRAFVDWVQRFYALLVKLEDQRGLQPIKEVLETLFGEEPTVTALETHMQRIREAEQAGKLRATKASGLTGAGGFSVSSHTNYGS